MASFSIRRKTTSWIEYVIPAPADYAEIMKAINGCEQRLDAKDPGRQRFDDDIVVEVGDEDKIIVRAEDFTLIEPL